MEEGLKTRDKKLGERLKKLRIKENLTQQQVADVLGITKATVSKYEHGERKLNDKYIEQLAQLYHADPLYIILGITQDRLSRSRWKQRLKAYHAHVETVRDESLSKIKGIFDRLNEEGMKKAVERVEELSEMQRYQRR